MRNKFAGQCYRCGGVVPQGAGYFERHNGGWRTQHIECCKQARMDRDEQLRFASERKRVDAERLGEVLK